ncbi:hypothetical protein R3P38DRAFT_951003 [Favolaschia claudopus]|uniref:Secreted protein n=1 Tax=Favolaschia claudopus TaxID=2862362 RepID=A0AAW0BMR7_9AGAR
MALAPPGFRSWVLLFSCPVSNRCRCLLNGLTKMTSNAKHNPTPLRCLRHVPQQRKPTTSTPHPRSPVYPGTRRFPPANTPRHPPLLLVSVHQLLNALYTTPTLHPTPASSPRRPRRG